VAITRMPVSGSLLGRGLAFPLRRDPITGDFATADEERNIESCLHQLIITMVGERQDARIGTVVPELPFESSDVVPDLGEPSIRAAIEMHEPRVEFLAASVTPEVSSRDTTGLRIAIRYRVRATGKRARLVIPYLFNKEDGAQ
jgi:phage baseplate assembly protein W